MGQIRLHSMRNPFAVSAVTKIFVVFILQWCAREHGMNKTVPLNLYGVQDFLSTKIEDGHRAQNLFLNLEKVPSHQI